MFLSYYVIHIKICDIERIVIMVTIEVRRHLIKYNNTAMSSAKTDTRRGISRLWPINYSVPDY